MTPYCKHSLYISQIQLQFLTVHCPPHYSTILTDSAIRQTIYNKTYINQWPLHIQNKLVTVLPVKHDCLGTNLDGGGYTTPCRIDAYTVKKDNTFCVNWTKTTRFNRVKIHAFKCKHTPIKRCNQHTSSYEYGMYRVPLLVKDVLKS